MSEKQVNHALSMSLLSIAKTMPPEIFASFLAGLLGNVTGNLSDDYWRQFCKIQICGEPGCNCCELKEKLFPALDKVRDDFLQRQNNVRGGGKMISLLEAISPTARLLLSGGGIVNIVRNSTKKKFRVHAPNANHAPVCGGGNSARGAHWQETFEEPNCKRCEKILNKRKEQNANSNSSAH